MLSPTGSGKSLVIYTLLRHYLNLLPKDQKVLIIVPTIGLVSQMFSDIRDYAGMDSNWNPVENCHIMYAGKEKNTRKRVVISTWQSLHKMPKEYFQQFGTVFGDEAHLFKSKSLSSIDQTHLLPVSYRNDRNTRRNAHSVSD